jgi:hypothetical protein
LYVFILRQIARIKVSHLPVGRCSEEAENKFIRSKRYGVSWRHFYQAGQEATVQATGAFLSQHFAKCMQYAIINPNVTLSL